MKCLITDITNKLTNAVVYYLINNFRHEKHQKIGSSDLSDLWQNITFFGQQKYLLNYPHITAASPNDITP